MGVGPSARRSVRESSWGTGENKRDSSQADRAHRARAKRAPAGAQGAVMFWLQYSYTTACARAPPVVPERALAGEHIRLLLQAESVRSNNLFTTEIVKRAVMREPSYAFPQEIRPGAWLN